MALLLWCTCVVFARESDNECLPSFVFTPAGTFFPRADGQLLFFEGVDLFTELGGAVQDGVYSALFAMVTTPMVMTAIGMLPAALAAGPAGTLLALAWKFRSPVRGWWSYLQGVRGLWNYQSWRIGRMPVYFASAAITRQLLVGVRYPLGVEHPPQLEIIRLPLGRSDNTDAGRGSGPSFSSVERAVLGLVEAMEREQISRMVATVKHENIILSIQGEHGHWLHRDMIRPPQALLVEQFYSWAGRRLQGEGYSLLQPQVINTLTRALHCCEPLEDAWLNPGTVLTEGDDASRYLLAQDGNRCDILDVVDSSTRLGGFAGYMYVRTGELCDTDLDQLALSSGAMESSLMARGRVTTVPYWFNRLMIRSVAESVSQASNLVFTPLWEVGSGLQNSQVFEATSGGARGWFSDHGLRCLSLAQPESGSLTPEQSQPICPWKLGKCK